MGSTAEGMSAIRTKTVKANLIDQSGQPLFDLMLLQEVWSETFLTDLKLTVVVQQKESKQCINCIIYQSDKLKEHNWDSVVEKMKLTEKDWLELKQSKGALDGAAGRLCIVIFGKKGEKCPAFVAISIHAPHKQQPASKEAFLLAVQHFGDAVVRVMKLPVLIGGDFNVTLKQEQFPGYQGEEYQLKRRKKKIDYILMKAPEDGKLEDVTATSIINPLGLNDKGLWDVTNHDPLTAKFTYPTEQKLGSLIEKFAKASI